MGVIGRLMSGLCLTGLGVGVVAGTQSACGEGGAAALTVHDGGVDVRVELQRAKVTGTVGSTRFTTREHFLAAGEMQISGEPLAEAMGRDLAGYSRDHLPADLYFDPAPAAFGPWIDLVGFSTAVESYEYSKQPMNNVAFESGAGTSLLYGPLVNPGSATGVTATALLAAKIQRFGEASNALGRFVFPAGTFPANNLRGGTANPLGAGKPADNPLGWPGIWPTVHVFRSFDPAVSATSELVLGCSVTSDDDPGATGALNCADYECNATSLHLTNRSAQIDATISPGADGFSAWKYGLWVLNYLQIMHDGAEAAVTSVAPTELASVGGAGNLVIGTDDKGAPTAAGTFLGSSDVEGFQAQLFIQELDDRAEDWLMHLSTADGVTLSGFAKLEGALGYDYDQALRWFPTAVAVTESDDGSGFPKPAFAVASPNSDLLDQIGLAMGYAEIYALTDTGNQVVGGSQPARAFFDGDPFAADDQKADGEPTLHDRALGLMRVALINVDRLHGDPASGVLVDTVTMNGATPTRGATVSTTSVAYTLLGLRTVLRSTGSQLQLYSNNKPDSAIAGSPLDAALIHPASGPTTFSARMQVVLRAQAALLFDHLTDASGRAWNGWDVTQGTHVDDDDLLDAHTAAVRGLFAAYLATGDVRFRERAVAVFRRLQAVFYDADARIYTLVPAPTDRVEYTPLRFALLQSALRDMYQLVAARPGGEALEPLLADRLGRLDKLVLNGWDDRNQNRRVDFPDECVTVQGKRGHGGLQMAERTLTGETGTLADKFDAGQASGTSDRERDCVPEIDDAHLPAALAGSITFQIVRP